METAAGSLPCDPLTSAPSDPCTIPLPCDPPPRQSAPLPPALPTSPPPLTSKRALGSGCIGCCCGDRIDCCCWWSCCSRCCCGCCCCCHSRCCGRRSCRIKCAGLAVEEEGGKGNAPALVLDGGTSDGWMLRTAPLPSLRCTPLPGPTSPGSTTCALGRACASPHPGPTSCGPTNPGPIAWPPGRACGH